VWISPRDGLPRRYSHWEGADGALAKLTATITSLAMSSALPADPGACEVPDGMNTREVQESTKPKDHDGLLPLGKAPKCWPDILKADPMVQAPQRATVLHLWCPRTSTMFRDYDAASRLQEMFDPKEVAVISISLADEDEAAQLLKDRGCKQFTRSVDSAPEFRRELTRGLPVFYVLDTDGAVRYARRGTKGGEDKFIARWIRGMKPTP
jgi:hypothetical protein